MSTFLSVMLLLFSLFVGKFVIPCRTEELRPEIKCDFPTPTTILVGQPTAPCQTPSSLSLGSDENMADDSLMPIAILM
jgi:hypothetical protein